MQVIFRTIELNSPVTVAAHHEPCGSHGAALVKGRSLIGKERAAGLNSLGRIMRDQNFAKDVGRACDECIRGFKLYRPAESRPKWHKKWADDIIAHVYGEEGDQDFLWRRFKNDRKEKKKLLVRIEQLLEVCWLPAQQMCPPCPASIAGRLIIDDGWLPSTDD